MESDVPGLGRRQPADVSQTLDREIRDAAPAAAKQKKAQPEGQEATVRQLGVRNGRVRVWHLVALGRSGEQAFQHPQTCQAHTFTGQRTWTGTFRFLP